jgi:adenylate kinase
MQKIILLGPQGSGKSTQSQLMADTLGVTRISSSGLLKKVVAEGTELGKKIDDLMDQGSLIPDELMIDLFFGELDKDQYKDGFLLDGFPRNIVQAEALDKKHEISKVFNLEISDELAMERISGRRVCENRHVFHVDYKPPRQVGLCDLCASQLFQRDDDEPEAVSKRLKIYRETTAKLLDYYGKQDKLVIFDGSGSIEEVSQMILDYLNKHVG